MKKINMAALTVAAICLSPMVVLADTNPLFPSVPEPGTIMAGAACLVPIAVGVVRGLRKNRK